MRAQRTAGTRSQQKFTQNTKYFRHKNERASVKYARKNKKIITQENKISKYKLFVFRWLFSKKKYIFYIFRIRICNDDDGDDFFVRFLPSFQQKKYKRSVEGFYEDLKK